MILLILQLLKSLYKYYKQKYYSILIIFQCSKKVNGWLTVTLNHINSTFFFQICKLQFFLNLRERKYAKTFSSQYIFCFLSLDTYYCKYLYKYFDCPKNVILQKNTSYKNQSWTIVFLYWIYTNISKILKIAGRLWYPVIHHYS